MATPKDIQRTKWTLVINNPLPTYAHDKIKELASLNLKTLCFMALCDEIGNETHTFHTHVFICCRSAVRFSTLHKIFPTAHIDAVKGKIQDNIDYLKKEGRWKGTAKAETSVTGSYEEIGTRPPEYAGKRNDLAELYEMIVVQHMSNADIIAYNPDYILQIDKLDKIRSTYLFDYYKKRRRLNLKVTYVFGSTGVGKTRSILDKHGDENVYRCTSEKNPFDGYSAEPVICFDEYRNTFKLKHLLNLLDVYPISLDARYSDRCACYEIVYIVSNWPLERQYQEEQTKDTASYVAFLSRIHEVIEYVNGHPVTYNTLADYFAAKKFKLPEGYKPRVPILTDTDTNLDNDSINNLNDTAEVPIDSNDIH